MGTRVATEKGSYILEIGGLIVGIVFFVTGVSDVARLFQARSAVRAAVNDGARCLYPTDADCVSASAGALDAPSRTFDVWVWGAGYNIERETFLASAKWLVEPVLEVNRLQDQIIDLTLEEHQFQYKQHSILYPITANIPYFVQTRYLPVIIAGTPLNPRFADPLTRRVSHAHASVSLSDINGVTTKKVAGNINSEYHSQLKIGAKSFTVQDAWPTLDLDRAKIATLPENVRSSLDCYAGSLNSAGNQLNWSATKQPCKYRYSGSTSSSVMFNGTPRVPLLLRVSGSTGGTVKAGEGKVTLAISWSSPTAGSSYKELGGRVFGYQGSGDFIPRGLALSDIDQDLRGDYKIYQRELDAYYELPMVPIDATVTLDLFLMSTNGSRVAWTGNSLEVWFPQYRFVEERSDCGYSSDSSKCVSPPVQSGQFYTTLSAAAPFMAQPDGGDLCAFSSDISAELDLQGAVQRIEQEVRRSGVVSARSFRLRVPTNDSVCAPRVVRRSCDLRQREYLEGCRAPIPDAEIARECAPVSAQSAPVRVLEITRKTNLLGAHRSRACSDAPLPQCARPYAREVSELLLANAAQCGDARSKSSAPRYFGPFTADHCESKAKQIEAIYRREEKLSPEIPISVERLPATPIFSAEKPTGQCLAYQVAEGSAREVLCGEGLSAQEAERCCTASSGRCRKREVIRGGSEVGSQRGGFSLTLARQRVIDTVRVAYPPAQFQEVCSAGARDCLQVQTALVDQNSAARVSAKVHVALNLIHLFNRDLSLVEHESIRKLERGLVF